MREFSAAVLRTESHIVIYRSQAQALSALVLLICFAHTPLSSCKTSQVRPSSKPAQAGEKISFFFRIPSAMVVKKFAATSRNRNVKVGETKERKKGQRIWEKKIIKFFFLISFFFFFFFLFS
jgi:hypothetical protein